MITYFDMFFKIEKKLILIHVISGGQKKTHRTLDACRFQSIYSIDMIFHICIAQSVLSRYRKFCYSNLTSFYDNVQYIP